MSFMVSSAVKTAEFLVSSSEFLVGAAAPGAGLGAPRFFLAGWAALCTVVPSGILALPEASVGVS